MYSMCRFFLILLLTFPEKICSHYFSIFQGPVYNIYLSCKHLFTLFIHLARTYSHICLFLLRLIYIIYPSCEDKFIFFTHLAKICSHELLIMHGPVHIIDLSCKDLFTLFIHLARTFFFIIYPSSYNHSLFIFFF